MLVSFNSDVNIGDLIRIKEVYGIIIAIHLTKIVALSEDGGRIIIPNQKLAEDYVTIYNKQRKSHWITKNWLKYNFVPIRDNSQIINELFV